MGNRAILPLLRLLNGHVVALIADHPITVGIFEGFSWIRCEGKGSFINSTLVKSFGEERIKRGETLLVVDLGGCTGMDSTFMGILAGLARRIGRAPAGGSIQIADVGERNRRSLEDLGFGVLLDIDPPATDWRERIASIREMLRPPQSTPQNMTEIVKVAHDELRAMNEKNAREFEGVVRILEKDLAARNPRLPGQGSAAPSG